MSLMDSVKRNVPKVELSQYNIIISGRPKSGKTTLFADLVTEHYGDANKALLLAFEPGYKALDVNAIDIENWTHFEEVADNLVDEKEELSFKFLGIDTADVLYFMAEEQVILEWNIKNPNKRTNDIGGVGAKGNSDQGFGVGYSHIKSKIRKVMDKLQKAGYGVMILTHDKDKTVEQRDGNKFDQLNLSLPTAAREIFVNSADFIVFITVDKIKTKTGVEQKRLMHFRSDGYVEAGSRFPNVPDSVEYGAKEFLDVFRVAIESELKGKGDIKKIAKQQEEESERKSKTYRETVKNNSTNSSELGESVDDVKSTIAGIITDMGKENKKALASRFKEEFGDMDYRKLTDTEKANKALEITREIAGA
jgi:hypothetical protein